MILSEGKQVHEKLRFIKTKKEKDSIVLSKVQAGVQEEEEKTRVQGQIQEVGVWQVITEDPRSFVQKKSVSQTEALDMSMKS